MATRKKTEAPTEMDIQTLKQGDTTVRLIGRTPLYFNAMAAKSRRDLLLGTKKKTAAQRKEIKHDPVTEFGASIYSTDHGPTLLCFPAGGIKSAMATAALETSGVTKTSVQRLIFLPDMVVPIWGTPKLKMDIVRSADMSRTPDVRTRAFVERWAAEVHISYVVPALNSPSIVALLANAGMVCGIGDFRQEKGRGSFGTFRVIGQEDPDAEWDDLMGEGRDLQELAMDAAEPADEETRELMALWRREIMRRSA